MLKKMTFVITAVAAFFLIGIVLADTLELKNGKLVEGTYMGGTQTTIRMQVGNEVKTFAVSEVLALTISQAAAPAASATPTSATAASAPAASAQSQTAAPPAAQPAAASVSVPSGTVLTVRLDETLDSKMMKPGYKFTATLEADLVSGNAVAAPRGSKVYGVLSEVKKSGRLVGQSELKIEFTNIMVNNKMYPIATGEIKAVSDKTGKQTVGRAARGAAIGALIDGSDGAKTGAAVGAGVSLLTQGQQVYIPKGTLLEAPLKTPFSM